MCSTCDSLQESIYRAERERNIQKAETMRAVLENHQRNTCPDFRHPVVQWQDGTTWKVKVS